MPILQENSTTVAIAFAIERIKLLSKSNSRFGEVWDDVTRLARCDSAIARWEDTRFAVKFGA